MSDARAAFRNLVIAGCAPDIEAARIIPAGAVDTPQRSPKGENPFAVIKWTDTGDPAFGKIGNQYVEVWFYDPQRTFSRLAPIMERCKDVITSAEHEVGEDDFTLTQADWTGDSTDMYDDMYGAVTRRSTYRVAARYTGS